jgi:alkyl hydroperoxide reductase subunit AhpC
MMIKYVFPFVVLMGGLVPNIGLGGLIGEPAPPLNVNEWIKGRPVAVKPGTNIYVVEIWETKSPISHASITNLNDLQRHFKTNGVVVVAVSDEPAERIKEFVEHDGANIEYEIAADNKRHTALSYMKPVGQREIPYVFVVGTNGDLLWHGPPQPRLSEILDQIIAGRYDEKQAGKMDLAWHQMQQYLDLALRGSDRAQLAGRTLLAARTNDVPLLCDLAFEIATAPRLATRDFALASKALDQAEKLAPTNAVPVGIARAILLFESGKRDEGLARATQLLASAQSPMDKITIQASLRTMEERKNAEDKRKKAEEKKENQEPFKTNAPLGKVTTSSNALIHPNP